MKKCLASVKNSVELHCQLCLVGWLLFLSLSSLLKE
uniref:Uncharacterized protein n=1 Tax=Rhizophora mucronata TaxID=61149 RepID=A0A2P2NQJ8_RHIMU